MFDASVAERASAAAIDAVSYRELAAGTLPVARRLRERGWGFGDRIALYCENRLAFVYTYLAALRLGAIAVSANVLYRSSDLAHVLADSAASLALASAQTQPWLADAGGPAADTVEAWAADGTIEALEEPMPARDALAVIIYYTSGTTVAVKVRRCSRSPFRGHRGASRRRVALYCVRYVKRPHCRSYICIVWPRSTAYWSAAGECS